MYKVRSLLDCRPLTVIKPVFYCANLAKNSESQSEVQLCLKFFDILRTSIALFLNFSSCKYFVSRITTMHIRDLWFS